MKRMTSEEILKVSRELIGSVYPIADSYYDKQRQINAHKSYSIISGLIADIGCMTCESYDSQFASVEECGIEGIKILKNLKQEIEAYLEEVEE